MGWVGVCSPPIFPLFYFYLKQNIFILLEFKLILCFKTTHICGYHRYGIAQQRFSIKNRKCGMFITFSPSVTLGLKCAFCSAYHRNDGQFSICKPVARLRADKDCPISPCPGIMHGGVERSHGIVQR